MPYPGAGKRYDLKTGLDQFGRPKPKGKPMRIGFTAEMADAARQAGFECNETEWAESVLVIEAERIVCGRRGHEKALEEANARLRDVLRLAQEGIAVLMQRYDNPEMEVQLEAIRAVARSGACST